MSFYGQMKDKTIKAGKKTVEGARLFSQKVNQKDQELKNTTGMGLLHTTGDRTGEFIGNVMGKPVEFVGQKINNKFIMELGEGFRKSTHFAGGITGQLGQGAWKSSQGILRLDGSEIWNGFGELSSATGKTIKGMSRTAVYTIKNSSDIVSGLYNKDYAKVKIGASGVAKVVIIAGVAISVVDLVDGGDIASAEDGAFLNTHNSVLDGQLHPETGVLYEAQTIELEEGIEVVGVFPVFDAVATVDLPTEMYESSDYYHFSYANGELAEIVSQNHNLANEFTPDQLEQIYAGETPDGFTWHHHEQLGRVELVDEEIHAKSGHSGGRSIWGGGSDAR